MPTTSDAAVETPIRLLAAGALFASGGIHLDLYITGYHAIPTIGPLFLVQTVSALLLGLALVVMRSRLLAASGALLALGTLVGYLLSRAVGMFGFHEVATTAGLSAGLLDCTAFVLLAYLATSAIGTAITSGGHHFPRLGQAEALMSSKAASYSVPLIGTAALVLALIGGLGGSSGGASNSNSPTAPAGTASIVITNFVFVPARLSVTPGERILVKNEDSVAHTLTATPGSSPTAVFNSGNIPAGKSKYVTAPSTAGTYQYLCSIHNFMNGEITVKAK